VKKTMETEPGLPLSFLPRPFSPFFFFFVFFFFLFGGGGCLCFFFSPLLHPSGGTGKEKRSPRGAIFFLSFIDSLFFSGKSEME